MNVSLVITTHNRGRLLRHSLERLTQLTIPDEIIVVDDGSSDKSTRRVCEDEFADRLPIRYIYTHNPGPSICSHARNVGFKAAKNDWVVTSEPELWWISDVIPAFIDRHPLYPNDIISCGKVYFAPEGWVPNNNDHSGFTRAGDYLPATRFQEAIGWVAPYTALWNKEWVLELGGWDEQFPGYWGWDDIDLLTRLRINGHGQYIDLDVKAVHQFHGLGGDVDFVNEGYFRQKSFSQGDETQTQDLIANQGKIWGEPINKP